MCANIAWSGFGREPDFDDFKIIEILILRVLLLEQLALLHKPKSECIWPDKVKLLLKAIDLT